MLGFHVPWWPQGGRGFARLPTSEKQKPSLLLEARARHLASSAAWVRELWGQDGLGQRGGRPYRAGADQQVVPGRAHYDTPPPGTTDKRPFLKRQVLIASNIAVVSSPGYLPTVASFPSGGVSGIG